MLTARETERRTVQPAADNSCDPSRYRYPRTLGFGPEEPPPESMLQ